MEKCLHLYVKTREMPNEQETFPRSTVYENNRGRCCRDRMVVGFITIYPISAFNNILTISWRSVVLVEETGVPEENHRPVVSRRNFLYRVHLA
jgi:hypothetical protein